MYVREVRQTCGKRMLQEEAATIRFTVRLGTLEMLIFIIRNYLMWRL